MKNARMTLEEMSQAFPDEWVLVSEPTLDDTSGWISSGFVQFHSPRRTDVDLAAEETPAVDIAVHYTGALPRRIYVL